MKTFLARLSLKARFNLLYATLLVLSVGVLGWYSYWNVWHLLVENTSAHLRARAKPVIEHWISAQGIAAGDSALTGIPRPALRALAVDLTSRNTVACILDKNGHMLVSGKRLPEEPDPPAPQMAYLRRALNGENEVTYRDQSGEKAQLVLLIPLRPAPGSTHILGVIQLSTSLQEIDRILFRHGLMLLIAMAIILSLGAGIGMWLTASGLKDLETLSATCRQIAGGHFGQRVPVAGRSDEIGQLASAFNAMLDKLEATFAAQRRFTANAAHELLTPLTALRGSLEVLLRGAQDDPAAVTRLSKGMYAEVTRLIRLCEQLLGLARLESSANLRKKTVHLRSFFRTFVQQAKRLAPQRKVSVAEGPDITLQADPDMLQQILLNLFTNALNHSSPDTAIVFSWRLLPGRVEILVRDFGSGIPKEVLPHVFEPFFSASPERRGAGLGLALVKSMTEAHGGSVTIESEEGAGTTVRIVLPLT